MAEPAVSANRLELLQIADAVAREKVIDKSIVLQAMEEAITRAAKARYGAENEIRAEIDPKSGEIRLNRLLLVSEKVENEATEISLVEANRRNPAARRCTSLLLCRPESLSIPNIMEKNVARKYTGMVLA